jgi:hypothetical protein
MIIRSAICCAALLAFIPPTWGADKSASKTLVKPASKPAAKAAPKTVPKTAWKPAPRTSAKTAPRTLTAANKSAFKPSPPLRGKTETLTCRDGTEDRHARIGVVLIGGKIDSFAYYSKWKPRTCSIYLQRNRDPYSKWVDKGRVTDVNLERGRFVLEHRQGEYRFVFRDIDRERYCGMDGTINGTLTIRKGAERCELTGIMEEGVPLGQAYASVEPASPNPPAVVSANAPEATPARRVFWWRRRQDDSPFPTPTAGHGD